MKTLVAKPKGAPTGKLELWHTATRASKPTVTASVAHILNRRKPKFCVGLGDQNFQPIDRNKQPPDAWGDNLRLTIARYRGCIKSCYRQKDPSYSLDVSDKAWKSILPSNSFRDSIVYISHRVGQFLIAHIIEKNEISNDEIRWTGHTHIFSKTDSDFWLQGQKWVTSSCLHMKKSGDTIAKDIQNHYDADLEDIPALINDNEFEQAIAKERLS